MSKSNFNLQTSPRITVIIPLYNKERYISKTIKSVLNQEFTDFEIVVIDDGSTDNSRQIVYGFLDKRIRLISKENGGVSSARNCGINSAKGKYLFFLDADDEILENCFTTFVDLLNKYPNESIYTTNFIYLDGNNRRIYCNKKQEHVIVNTYKAIYKFDIFPRTGNLMVDRDLVVNKCLFNESLSIYEDFDFIVRLVEGKSVVYSPLATFIYIRDNAQLSINKRNYNKEYISIAKVDGSFYKRLVVSRYILNYYKGVFPSLYYRFSKLRTEFPFLIIAYCISILGRINDKFLRIGFKNLN